MRIGQSVAWVEEETYHEGVVRGIFEGTLVVNRPTNEGFSLHIIPLSSVVPLMEPHWRDIMCVDSRVHVFCEGLWIPGKVIQSDPTKVEVALALTRTSQVYNRTSQRLSMIPPNLYDEGLWMSDIAFRVDDPGSLWGCWEKDGVVYEMVDCVFGTAVLYAVGTNDAMCIPRNEMDEFTLVQEAQEIQEPQFLKSIQMIRPELSAWCSITEPSMISETLRDRSHTVEGSQEKKWMCRLFNMQRFSSKFHPSNHHRNVGAFGGPLVYLQTMIDLLTPYGASDRALRFACMSAMFADVYQKAMIIRLRREEKPYLLAEVSLSSRYAIWRISWSGVPVQDVRHHVLNVTPFLRDIGIISLPHSAYVQRSHVSKFSRLSANSAQGLFELIGAREVREIGCAFATSALGGRFYNLCLGFIPRPSPVFGGAIACSMHDIDYRDVFARICKLKGGRTFIFAHVNVIHLWVKKLNEHEVPVIFGDLSTGDGVHVISYHSMRHLHVPRADRVIFEDSQVFGPNTGIVKQAQKVEAPIRWCVSKMPRTSFPALHGTLRMLQIVPFTRRDVAWNHTVDRSMSVLGSTPYYNMLKQVFTFVPEKPFDRPKVRHKTVDPGHLALLLMQNRACQPYKPLCPLHVQSSMLSSMLLPMNGFEVSSDAVCLDEELQRRRISPTRKEEILKEMEDKCPVCLERVDDWRLSPCNHVLCPQCVEACRTLTDNTCPICRSRWIQPFVNPMRPEVLEEFKRKHEKLNERWVLKETKRLFNHLKVGPKLPEIQRLTSRGHKCLIICAHKKHVIFLGKHLGCPYICSGLKNTQRWSALDQFENESLCLVSTADVFQWSLALKVERLIFVEPPTRSEYRTCLQAVRPAEVFMILASGFPDASQPIVSRSGSNCPAFPRALSLVYGATTLSSVSL